MLSVSPQISRRTFLKASVILAGSASLNATSAKERSHGKGPLMGYVGTFSSPLRNVLATQVDLPPGNGRGIHLYQLDRLTGAMTASELCELGNSPDGQVVNASGTRLY